MTGDPRPRGRGADDRGAGLIASTLGVLVIILFLVVAAQVLLGLYATTTLRAAVYDAASRAASQDGPRTPSGLAGAAAEARASLGSLGHRGEVSLEAVDTDGDGLADVIVGRASAVPPRVVPPSVGGMFGFEEVHAGAQVRIERPR